MKKNLLVIIFIGFISIFSIVDIITKDKSFAEIENRPLKKSVKFTKSGFLDGSFSKNYSKYLSDQLILRDKFITLKSFSENLLLKKENNGIIMGEDGYLFDKFNNIEKDNLKENIEIVNEFKKQRKEDVYFMLAPNSYEIYKEKYDNNISLIDQEIAIKKVYEEMNDIKGIDILKRLKEKKEDYIYYKTDHHWTTRGAYIAYKEFINLIGEKEIEYSEECSVDNFYGTYYSQGKPYKSLGDKFLYNDFKEIEAIENGEKVSIYDYEKLNTRDKYSFFLGGNKGLTVLKNPKVKNNKKILVIKDSFANSLVPFLTYHYEEVHVIDLRYFMNSLNRYIEKDKFNQILILYNFINFTKDDNIIGIKK